MNSSVSLQPNFTTHMGPIWILGLFLLITFIIGIAKIQQKKPKKVNTPKPVASPQAKSNGLNPIQTKYLAELDLLNKSIKAQETPVKEGYQALSVLYRNFIQDNTGMEVTNKTLSELKKLGKPIISELVAIYYAPEFDDAEYGYSELTDVVKSTRKAIKEWK